MWEFCVEASKKNAHIIDYISQRLENVISSVDGVKSYITFGNSSSVAVGCPKKHYQKLEGALRVIICDAICEKMKFDYLKNHIVLSVSDEKLFDAFIKVYTYFDSEIERKIVLRSLFFKNKIVLESFLSFRLQPLKKKWEEMCNLTNTNSNLFLQSETFIELLKFLISNLDCKMNTVVLDLSSNIVLYEERGNALVALLNFQANDDIGIITQIIELCPRKIKIISGNNNEVVSLIGELFENRVEIIK